MNSSKQFNIRVYGLLINKHKQVLITDEYRMGTYMTKFPGGGLEYGEGTIDCLKREFKEELNIDIEIKSHFYTTDFFQPAMFFNNMQLISIYYLVDSKQSATIKTTAIINDIPEEEGAQAFRWVNINELIPASLTFPIDQKVASLVNGLNY